MRNWNGTVRVLIVYLICLIAGQALAVGVGLMLDPYSKTAALATFIPLYYAMYWVAWRLALMIADRSPAEEPRPGEQGGGGARLAALLLAPAVLAVEICD